MRILAALFIEDMQLRQAPGPSTRIDLTGIKFSEVSPSAAPVTITPHLVVLLYCPPDGKPEAALEVTYHRDGDQVARNLQLADVEPGKFSYRLVRAELTFDDYGSVEAHCRVDDGEPLVVPYTLLPPVT
ncbi:MAG: hypothetical protein ACRD29_18415 [Acidimicrobiales bacterium]